MCSDCVAEGHAPSSQDQQMLEVFRLEREHPDRTMLK